MSWSRSQQLWHWVPRPVRIILVLAIGGTVLLIGVFMIVLPGPAFIVLPLGLAILAIEFAFARRWLMRIRQAGTHVRQRIKNGWAEQKTPR